MWARWHLRTPTPCTGLLKTIWQMTKLAWNAVSLTGLMYDHNCTFRPLLCSLLVVTPEWLTIRHSCIIATNMAYYSLPLWNRVLRKVVLSMPWRRNGGAEVQLHSFLTLATKWRRVVNSTPWPLYTQGRVPIPLCIRGWVVPRPVWIFPRREKSQVSTGVQNPYLAACSTVIITHSLTQTTQWTKTLWKSCMHNVLYIVCCYANSPRWYMELLSIESVCLVDCISNFLYL